MRYLLFFLASLFGGVVSVDLVAWYETENTLDQGAQITAYVLGGIAGFLSAPAILLFIIFCLRELGIEVLKRGSHFSSWPKLPEC